MNRLKEKIKKKWKVMTGLTAMFMLVFLVGFAVKAHFTTKAADARTYTIYDSAGKVLTSGQEYTMRRLNDLFTVTGAQDSQTKYEWQSLKPDVLRIGQAGTDNYVGTPVTTTGTTGSIATKALIQGSAGLRLTVTENINGVETTKSFTFTINVQFSINESLDPTTGVEMTKVFDTDDRKAIIMDYHSATTTRLEFGTSASDSTQKTKLNFMFGNAQNGDWVSSNKDVVKVEGKGIVAIGPGRAKLTVTYQETGDTVSYTDEIWVYVRPEVKYESADGLGTANGQIVNSDVYSQSLVVRTGDYLDCQAKFESNPNESISSKLVWVISKEIGSKKVLIKDSLGNSTAEYKDDAELVWLPSLRKYQLKAKAETYIVQFFVAETYPGFDNLDNSAGKKYHCDPVNIAGGVQVKTNYKTKNETINIGGHYDLTNAFNISLAALQKNFSAHVNTNYDGNNGTSIISFDSKTWNINTTKTGKAQLIVERHPNQNSETNIPEFKELGDQPDGTTGTGVVHVNITVMQTFSMNVSTADMSVGSTQLLYGMFGEDKPTEADQFKWDPSDDSNNEYISISTNGQYATVTAKKETPSNSPVTVTLSWTNSDGLTLTTTCKITVRKSVDKFNIVPNKVSVEVGQQQIIATDLTESRNLIWLSSDPKVGTIEQISGTTNPSAMFTALKAGKTVITALNPDNNVYATCEVTVTQPVTKLAIGVEDQDTKQVTQYDTYTTTLAMKYVFMKAIYGPSDTTENESDFKWSVEGTSLSDVKPTDIAEIDSSGKVTMKREGDVYIKVQSANMYATCHLIIQSRPMTGITTDVTNLSMIKGDTYTVKTTYLPENASDTRMTWKSDDAKVATVNSSGVITAVGPGTTSIKVSAVLPQSDDNHTIASATIVVTVRERLVSIAFGSNAEYIAVGGSKTVDLRFTPSDNVNKNVTYSSSDTSIFTVTQEGVITGVKEGIAVLSCVAEDLGQSGAVTCMVYVTPQEVSATDFSITPSEDTVYIGSTIQLTPVFTPEDTTIRDVTWTSSDEAKATVDADGVVSGIAEGTTVITATYKDTTNDNKVWTSTCIVTVEKAPIYATGFEVSPTTQNIICGDEFTITPKFTPEDTTNQTVIYQSLDETIVTVNSNGVVTGVGPGDAIVQCTSVDGGFNATVAVHVDNAVDFKLSPQKRDLAIGQSFTPKKVIKPANAKKTATWKSSNTKIATVNSAGKVTAKKKGTCTITCTLTKYRQSATCKVKVGKLYSKVSLNKHNIRIGLNQSYRLKATVKTNAAKTPKLKWKSSNSRILKVSSGGKITAKRVGIARVTVMTKDAIHAKASCKVRVIRRVSSIRLNTNYTVCYVGRSKQLHAIIKPKSASVKKVKWQSSDKNILQVNSSGKIWGIAEGDAYVTATTTDGSNKRARCFVKVVEPTPITSIVIAQQDVTMKRGDSLKLSYSVLPSDNSDDIEFSSDNKRVATVNRKGVIKAVGTGNATITILATSGVSSTVNVNVVALNKSELNLRQYDSETLIVHGTANAVTWYSSNTRVAVVTNGKVVAKGIGTAYIYAYVNGCKLGCQINVTSVNNKNR